MDQYLSDNCYIEEINGFLKYTCPDEGDKMKCHNTDEYYYNLGLDPGQYGYLGSVCSDDPHFYQACDNRLMGFRATNDVVLCDNYFCDQSADRFPIMRYLVIIGIDVCS